MYIKLLGDLLQRSLVLKSTFNVWRSLFQNPRGSFLALPATINIQKRFFDNEPPYLPPSVDWRTKGAVTYVKNQGPLGTCWAFSALAAIEAVVYQRTKNLISLSAQELCDCEPFHSRKIPYDRGHAASAFWYIIKDGIYLEQHYPYIMKYEACKILMNAPKVYIDEFVRVACNEIELMKAVVKQPVVVTVDCRTFQYYNGGVFAEDPRDCFRDQIHLDHQMLCVGYGTTRGGVKYWVLKNSWGPTWAESGYMRMLRGVNKEGGLCGITMDVNYPILHPHTPAMPITVFQELF